MTSGNNPSVPRKNAFGSPATPAKPKKNAVGRPKNTAPVGRPAYTPSEEDRKKVINYVAADVSKEAIALTLGICRQTLYTHYPEELEHGKAMLNAETSDMMKSLAEMAKDNPKYLPAAIHFDNTRSGRKTKVDIAGGNTLIGTQQIIVLPESGRLSKVVTKAMGASDVINGDTVEADVESGGSDMVDITSDAVVVQENDPEPAQVVEESPEPVERPTAQEAEPQKRDEGRDTPQDAGRDKGVDYPWKKGECPYGYNKQGLALNVDGTDNWHAEPNVKNDIESVESKPTETLNEDAILGSESSKPEIPDF